jgi:ParB-like chromosome segregation protein Spo0J
MPTQIIKDLQTGEERRVYVAPKGMGQQSPAKAAASPAAKPAAKSKQSNPLTAVLNMSPIGWMSQLTGNSIDSIGTAVSEFQKSGDLGQAINKGQQQYAKGLEGPGAFKGATRVLANAGRNILQETSDFLTADLPAAFGDTAVQPTTAQRPDAPFLGVMPALPKAKSSGPAEDLVTGLVQAGVEWLPAARVVGLAGKGLKVLPGAAKVGQGLKAVQGAAKNPVAKALVSNTLTKAAATGALIDTVGFDQHGGRLTDLIDQATQGTPFNALALDYLKSNPGDVGMEGRLKNALEGGLFGTALETALRTMRVARNFNWWRRAPEAEKPAAQEALRKATQDLEIEVARQSYTVPDVGPELSVSVPGQPPAPRDMQPPGLSDVAEVNPQEIAVDPQRFQFKEAGRLTKSGASGSLSGSTGYNPMLGGVVSVWRDPADGVTYVVNGHNRLKLAKESDYDKLLVRYIDAPNAEQARAMGALQNIAEGQGTPVDAAKYMRDTGESAETLAGKGVNLSGPVIAKAIPLSRLPQNLFDKVATGQLDLAKAVALGSEALDQQVINDVAAEATKRKWSAEKITQAMQEAKFATTTVADDGDLLGILGAEWASKTSNFNQLLDVRTEAYRLLREEMVALTSTAREGRRGILESAGNVIDVAGSQAARSQAAQAVGVFNRVTGYVGPVRDLLNEMAGQVKGKRTAKAVVGENLDRLRQAIDDEVNGPRLPLDEAPVAPVARAADEVVAPVTEVAAARLPEPEVSAPTAKVKFTSTQRAELENMNTTLMREMGIDLNQGLTRQQLETLERTIRLDYAPVNQGGIEEVSAATRKSMMGLADKLKKAVDGLPVEPPAAAGPSVPSAGSSAPEQVAQPLSQAPAPAAAPAAPAPQQAAPTGPTAAEIQELDTVLSRSMANLSPQQRVAVRNQMLQQKYGEPTMAVAPEQVDLPPQAGRQEPTADGPLVIDEDQVANVDARQMDGGGGSGGEPPSLPPAVVEPPPMDEGWARQLVDQMAQQRQALEEGTVTMDDLLENNVQKFQSPSGATAYVPSAPTNAIQAYRAFSDVFSRPDATGIPVMSFERVQADTETWLARNNYDGQAVLENLKQLSGPLSNYQDNLVALRAAQLYTDHANLQAGVAANKWLNAGADETADIGQLTAELLTAAAQQKNANIALEGVTRPIGQLLYSLQNPRPTPGSLPFDEAIPMARPVADQLEEALELGAQTPVAESIGKALSPEAEQAILTGAYSPQVLAEMDQLARAMAQMAVTPGVAKGFWKQMNESVAVGARGLVIYRASQLLSSGLTLWSNTINNAVRLTQLPLSQALGATMQGDLGRASQSLLIYGQYISNLQNALRLGVESFKAGRGLYDLDETSVDFLDKLAKQDLQESLLPGAQASGEWSLDTMPWLDVQNKSNWAMAQKRIWQALNLSTRTQVSLDTFFKTLAGQSFEYVRNIQPGLDRAIQQGLPPGSREAWTFARDYAQAAVDRATRDVAINGRTILDAVMTSPQAQTAMRYATFTDDIWAQMGPKTYQEGLRLAEARGLQGDAAADAARKYMETAGDIPAFGRAFSMMPAAWQKLIDFSPLFSIIQPFNRTPGDIVKSVARMTPGANFFVDTWWRDINGEDAFARDRALGDLALGAAAISLGTVAMTQGRMEFTGGGPANPAAQRKWRDEGKQPYSFRVKVGEDENGKPILSGWVSMRVFEPFSSLFGGLADYQEIANKLPKEARERLGSALTMDLMAAVGAGQLNKTYYQGFSELYEAAMGVGEVDIGPNRRNPVERYISRILASMVPGSSALRAGRRIEDRTARDIPPSTVEGGLAGIPMRLFQETLSEIKNMIPGWSEQLPPRRNWVTGETIVLSGIMGDQYLPPDQPWLSFLYQYVPWSPFQTAPKADPVLMEMASLSGRGATFRGPTNTDFGRELRLDPVMYDEYVQTTANVRDQFGRTVHQALDELISSDYYKSLPDEEISTTVMSQRAAAIDLEVSKFRKLGRDTFLSNHPEIQREVKTIEGLNNDVKYRLKYGQPIDVNGFVEGLR